jgi:aspartate 1-decarboxylase
MPETSKTLRQMLLGKIHRAVVTRADLDSVGSITLDGELAEAAGFLPHEKIDIYDVTNGARLSTYVTLAERGSGEVGLNGAAAHLVRPGDLVILASYGWMKEKSARRHRPRIIHVDQENRPKAVVEAEGTPPQDPFGHLSARVAGAVDQDEQDMGLDVGEAVEADDGEADGGAEKRKKKRRDGKKQKKTG